MGTWIDGYNDRYVGKLDRLHENKGAAKQRVIYSAELNCVFGMGA